MLVSLIKDRAEPAAVIDPFEKVWTSAFGATLPLGHCLRHEHFDRWTRFHSLPSSKRYSGTLDERQIILHRANTLGYECFTAGEQIWLVSCPLFATLLETCDGSNDD